MWEKSKYPEALHTQVLTGPVFTGAGTDDLTVSGSVWFATTRQYVVEIDGVETYRWSNDNGSTWEAEGVTIFAGQFINLVNAEGEDEGVVIRFGSRTGHVATDAWAFSTTGQVVPDSLTALGEAKNSEGAEVLTLKIEYSKGTETGIKFAIALPHCKNGTVLYGASLNEDVGAGLEIDHPYILQLDASSSTTFKYELDGAQWYRIYAVKKGGTVAGTFTCFHELSRKIK